MIPVNLASSQKQDPNLKQEENDLTWVDGDEKEKSEIEEE